MELREFLNNISQEGNHWIDYKIIMGNVRNYEEKYEIKISIIIDSGDKSRQLTTLLQLDSINVPKIIPILVGESHPVHADDSLNS